MWREKNKSHGDSTSGGFNPFSVSLMLGNSIGAVRGKKLEESQGTARDAAIAGWRHVSPLRGKGWVIHNWELVRTCVEILRDINWKGFWGVFAISFYPYNYYNELYMFDRPIVVKLICYCVECEPYKSSTFSN